MSTDTLRVFSFVCDGRLGRRAELAEEVNLALEEGIDVISAQGNGLDAGPHFLGAGESPPPLREALEPAIFGALDASIPFVMSLGGRAGADVHVEPYLELLDQIAHDRGKRVRVAFISGELDKDWVRARLRAGVEMPRLFDTPRLSPYLTEQDVDAATRIEAQMGPEPIVKALELFEAGEIDGVLTGRALDVGIHMAYPLLKGFPKASAAHMAKVIECGGLCCTPASPFTSVIARLSRDDGFTVGPVRRDAFACTPRSVATHAFYEREDPSVERNPGGILDIGAAVYSEAGPGQVHCTGARWTDAPYAVKLEGATGLGFETTSIAILSEPTYIAVIDKVLEQTCADVVNTIAEDVGVDRSAMHVTAIVIGRDALPSGGKADHPPQEIAILIRAVAPTRDASHTLCNSVRVRVNNSDFPGRKTTAGNLAFPFSNLCIAAGEMYVFNIWHLLPLDDPLEPFPIQTLEFPRRG